MKVWFCSFAGYQKMYFRNSRMKWIKTGQAVTCVRSRIVYFFTIIMLAHHGPYQDVE